MPSVMPSAVKKVSASHGKGEADIISEEPIDEAKLREVIGKTGYDFVSMTSKPYEKHGLFGFPEEVKRRK